MAGSKKSRSIEHYLDVAGLAQATMAAHREACRAYYDSRRNVETAIRNHDASWNAAIRDGASIEEISEAMYRRYGIRIMTRDKPSRH